MLSVHCETTTTISSSSFVSMEPTKNYYCKKWYIQAIYTTLPLITIIRTD